MLRAGSVKEMTKKDWDFVTNINYTGYFLCVKYAAKVMAAQIVDGKGLWSDVVQVNSKSGLEGSNKNGAYAGSKFGTIGLTQSFAKELVTDCIKVNSVCPGNYYDGPLWSDPERRSLCPVSQYRQGAWRQDDEDVRRFYEDKVPMAAAVCRWMSRGPLCTAWRQAIDWPGHSRHRRTGDAALTLFYPQIPLICARDFFYPQIPQISADYGGLSCRCAAIHAAGRKARRLIFPHAKAPKARKKTNTKMNGGCLAAARAIQAADRKGDGGADRVCPPYFPHAKARRREEDKYKDEWRPVLPLRAIHAGR